MVPSSMRKLLGAVALSASLLALQPQSPAVSDFTFYVDINSVATSDCRATGAGVCSGNCVSPTCGTLGIPCKNIQTAIDIANCTIGFSTTLQADVMVAPGTYAERLFIFPSIHVIGLNRDTTTIDSQGVACGSGGNRCSVAFFSEGAGFGFSRP